MTSLKVAVLTGGHYFHVRPFIDFLQRTRRHRRLRPPLRPVAVRRRQRLVHGGRTPHQPSRPARRPWHRRAALRRPGHARRLRRHPLLHDAARRARPQDHRQPPAHVRLRHARLRHAPRAAQLGHRRPLVRGDRHARPPHRGRRTPGRAPTTSRSTPAIPPPQDWPTSQSRTRPTPSPTAETIATCCSRPRTSTQCAPSPGPTSSETQGSSAPSSDTIQGPGKTHRSDNW